VKTRRENPKFELGKELLWAGLSIAATFAIIYPTIARDVNIGFWGGDGPELALAASGLGVAHPPGYPIWVIIGHLFSCLPIGTLYGRLSLFSGFSIALVAGAMMLTFRCLAKRLDLEVPSAACCILAVFAVLSRNLWHSAVITEIYALKTLIFSIILLWLCLRIFAIDKRNILDEIILGILLGIAVSHHLPVVFFAPGIYFFALRGNKCKIPSILRISITAASVGIACFALLPLLGAKGGSMVWGDMSTSAGFFDHVLGKHYQGLVFTKGWIGYVEKLPDLLKLFVVQWNPVVAAVIITVFSSLGIFAVRGTNAVYRTFFVGWSAMLCIPTILNLFYDIPDLEVYFNDVFLAAGLAFPIGYGLLAEVVKRSRLSGRLLYVFPAVYLAVFCIGLRERFEQTNLSGKVDPAVIRARSMAQSLADNGYVGLIKSGGFFFLLKYELIQKNPGSYPPVISLDLLPSKWYRKNIAPLLTEKRLTPLPVIDKIGHKQIASWIGEVISNTASDSGLARVALDGPFPEIDRSLIPPTFFENGWFQFGKPRPTSWISGSIDFRACGGKKFAASSPQPLAEGWQPCIYHSTQGPIFDLISPDNLDSPTIYPLASGEIEFSFPSQVKAVAILGATHGGTAEDLEISDSQGSRVSSTDGVDTQNMSGWHAFLGVLSRMPMKSFPSADEITYEVTPAMAMGSLGIGIASLSREVSKGKIINRSASTTIYIWGISGLPAK